MQKANELLKNNLYNYYFKTLGLKDYRERISIRENRIYAKKVIGYLEKFSNLKNKKILDIGSGWGELCIELSKHGASAVGVEPDKNLLEIASPLGKEEGSKAKFVNSSGEKNSFS